MYPLKNTEQKMICYNIITQYYFILVLHYWVDTSDGGLIVLEGIILPVVSASSLTWFIRYISVWNVYISAGRLLIQGSIFLPVVKHIEPWRILAILIRPVNLPSPKYFDYLWFPTCLLWAYQTMVIRETRACVLNYIRYLRFNWVYI